MPSTAYSGWKPPVKPNNSHPYDQYQKKKGNKKVDKELLEKASKAKSVGNTMDQFDIYLDEFQEKEK